MFSVGGLTYSNKLQCSGLEQAVLLHLLQNMNDTVGVDRYIARYIETSPLMISYIYRYYCSMLVTARIAQQPYIIC